MEAALAPQDKETFHISFTIRESPFRNQATCCKEQLAYLRILLLWSWRRSPRSANERVKCPYREDKIKRIFFRANTRRRKEHNIRMFEKRATRMIHDFNVNKTTDFLTACRCINADYTEYEGEKHCQNVAISLYVPFFFQRVTKWYVLFIQIYLELRCTI